jgi:hypothetical protein
VLGAPDGERRDEDLAAAAGDGADDLGELLLLILLRRVDAVAVGAFEDHRVGAREQLGALQDRERRAAEVAGEDDPFPFGLELDERRAEHVAGVVEGGLEVRCGLEDLVVGDGLEERGGRAGVVHGVERLPRGSLLFVDELDVALLDRGGILEHERGEIGGREVA